MSPVSSSSFLLLLLLLLPHPRSGATASDADAQCVGAFRSGQEDFVLDVKDAVERGADLLDSACFQSEDECERACCKNRLCNLALLEPRAPDGNRTCVLFNCVYRNRFVCRFANQAGYRSYVRRSVYREFLGGPGAKDPPIADAGRDVIVQPGETVLLNGTESLALGDAKITDYRWSLQSEDRSVKIEKTSLTDQIQVSDLQPGSYVFQLTVTDSNGRSGVDKVTVLVLNPEQTSLYCQAPLKVGPCRAAFPRWRYDAVKGSCETFTFGGCKENKNNFVSEDACQSACRGVTAQSERISPLPGGEVCGSPCRPDQLTCGNGCCLDRSLECDGVNHCSDASDEDRCNKLNQTFTQLLDIHVNQIKAQCTEPPHTGPCRASFTHWYYNPLDRKCYSFTYGGCDGNGNNFEKHEKCSETCKGVNESNLFSRSLFERFEPQEEEGSGSVALGVILSVAILALLAIMTYCFLKNRRKRANRPVDTGSTHEAPPELDALVYNSTTKPV